MTPDSNIASHGTGYAGTVFSVFAVMISMLPELDVWFRILASVSAIIEEKTIIFYEQTDESIATPTNLFVGTQEECEAEISRLQLKHPHESEL